LAPHVACGVSILMRLESGLSNKEIAETNFVSEGTLKVALPQCL